VRWTLYLEKFNYVVEHRPGKSLCHVDALSRNPSQILLIEEDHSGLVTRISKTQREDHDLQPFFETSMHSNDFVLQNEILYRKFNDALLLVVPKSICYDVIGNVTIKAFL